MIYKKISHEDGVKCKTFFSSYLSQTSQTHVFSPTYNEFEGFWKISRILFILPCLCRHLNSEFGESFAQCISIVLSDLIKGLLSCLEDIFCSLSPKKPFVRFLKWADFLWTLEDWSVNFTKIDLKMAMMRFLEQRAPISVRFAWKAFGDFIFFSQILMSMWWIFCLKYLNDVLRLI